MTHQAERSRDDLGRGSVLRSPRSDGSSPTRERQNSPTRPAQCAADITRSVRALGLEIRVGLPTGEVEFVGDDVRGIAVHTAARVLALAGPGEVLASSTTGGLLEGSGIELDDAGLHEMQGLAGPRQVFRLVLPPTP